MATDKPAVLIIGGLGFVGRHLALHIHKNNLASELRIVDKLLPQLAWLAPEFEQACSKEQFVQADASREQSYPRIFDRADGKQFDYVINCAADTRPSQPEEVYQLRNHAMCMGLAKEVAKRNIKVYAQASTSYIYKSGSKPAKEDDKKKPWHNLAKWQLQVEEDLPGVEGLNWVSLRLPHIYGEYDRGYTAVAIALARTHQWLQTGFDQLESKDLKFNTLHVKDAACALWTAAEWRAGEKDNKDAPHIFNVVDHTDTTRDQIGAALAEVFDLKVTFAGMLVSQLARLKLNDIVDEMNEEMLQAWADMLEEKGITRPGPISPFIEIDMLSDNDLCIDGSLFESTTGFQLEYPRFSSDSIREVIASYERMGWWP
ncbi:epimerase/dehydratase family protein, putative [Talaromyces stipitatus ATCC 10500]|uniref:Epimerase/dehydratase family protein, putative n=1 Tax=Talaromyces stipitatus (strain ATCC 10500 / CBS 375.48 / QM 6759 / NRRL 1006) TaxID=441959 RepID=B8MH69_TALSN|nr:epimerase/dehydratase family protein, putative [Talaromyces stipitatus ATCC 10500]EED16883.1 epimerase/dehydratase family protein, putative [Talaromyces stipitatus ATCC 10500]